MCLILSPVLKHCLSMASISYFAEGFQQRDKWAVCEFCRRWDETSQYDDLACDYFVEACYRGLDLSSDVSLIVIQTWTSIIKCFWTHVPNEMNTLHKHLGRDLIFFQQIDWLFIKYFQFIKKNDVEIELNTSL